MSTTSSIFVITANMAIRLNSIQSFTFYFIFVTGSLSLCIIPTLSTVSKYFLKTTSEDYNKQDNESLTIYSNLCYTQRMSQVQTQHHNELYILTMHFRKAFCNMAAHSFWVVNKVNTTETETMFIFMYFLCGVIKIGSHLITVRTHCGEKC